MLDKVIKYAVLIVLKKAMPVNEVYIFTFPADYASKWKENNISTKFSLGYPADLHAFEKTASVTSETCETQDNKRVNLSTKAVFFTQLSPKINTIFKVNPKKLYKSWVK